MANEPGAAVVTLFNDMIDFIKQSRPVQSDGKTPMQKDFFYSTMILGMPVDPEDFEAPWSPIGGATLQDTINNNGLAPSGSSAESSSSTTSDSTSTAGSASSSSTDDATQPNPKLLRSLQAAYKTSVLADVMLQVTTDGTYMEYPTGRHLDFAYSGVVNSMTSPPVPPLPDALQKQLDAAKKVLYQPDPYDPDNIVPTPLYQRYQQNSVAYAQAKASFALQQAMITSNPATAQVAPQLLTPLQQAVDNAYDTFRTEDADVVEAAIDSIEAVGMSMQDHQIAAARKLLDVWSLDLAGVPAAIPYSFVMPTNWCVPNVTDDGFEHLEISQGNYASTDTSNWSRNSQGSWSQNSSSSGGGGAISIGFAAFGGSGGSASSDTQWQGSASHAFSNTFANDASGLTISMSYGLVTFYRPWLQSDLFSMDNWYLRGQKKGTVSDGTVAGQAGDHTKLLPAIPQQFLVIKDVSISATNWGSDAGLLSQYYGSAQSNSSSSSSSEQGGGGVCLGFINLGGSASHSQSQAHGQSSSWQQAGGTSYFGTHFDGTTLTIPGAQIIAFVCDIVPESAPMDDPNLNAPSAASSSTPAASTVATPA